MSAPEKTPVQVLQEFCQKECKTPHYELVQAEGKDHFPTFMYKLTVGETTVSGILGLSKKKAKHAAAELMLEKLGVMPPSTEDNCISKVVAAQIPRDNAVGELQSLCLRRQWDPPKYTVVSVQGPSHAPVFTMDCTMEKFNVAVSGTGRCKKDAKQLVATQMLQSLKGNPHITWLESEAKNSSPTGESRTEDSSPTRESRTEDSSPTRESRDEDSSPTRESGAVNSSPTTGEGKQAKNTRHGEGGVLVEERRYAAGRGHIWKQKLPGCNCNRPVQNVRCTQCGYTTQGHVKVTCPIHSEIIHLMDLVCCSECGATTEKLQEFPLGVKKTD